jgi:hypothetical protein
MADTGLVEGFLSAGIAGFAVLLMVVALAAWRRVGGGKMLGLAGAFALFAVKGLWAAAGLLGTASAPAEPLPLLALDFGVLLLLYIGTVR